ncbi:MAG: metal-dependent transcriptional regulator [Eubacteriales bacterium]|nr:metal-dependent transcriptional regulator [Eubacteriales bacterium]
MKIMESAENYLETILVLSHRMPHVRSIDIVNELSYSKPSISVAMKNLRENGYIRMDSDGYITLTPAGREIAEKIYERHTLLTDWLVFLGVSEKTAEEDACRIEHVISAESFEMVKKHVYAKRELASTNSPQN